MKTGTKREHLSQQLTTEREKFEEILHEWFMHDQNELEIIEKWTIKDIVAHITAWEIELIRWLERAALGKPPDILAPGLWSDFTERSNRQTYEANRTRSLEHVLLRFRQVYDQLLIEIQALPEDPSDDFWLVWLGGRPPWDLFATFPEHYREHSEQIKTRLLEEEKAL